MTDDPDELCECGQPADPRVHSPLPKPRPMVSWHAQRHIDSRLGTKIARASGYGRTKAKSSLQETSE